MPGSIVGREGAALRESSFPFLMLVEQIAASLAWFGSMQPSR